VIGYPNYVVVARDEIVVKPTSEELSDANRPSANHLLKIGMVRRKRPQVWMQESEQLRLCRRGIRQTVQE
jgi:hypothetical protein